MTNEICELSMDELNAVSGGDNTVTYNVMGCEFTVTGLANGSAMGIYSKTGDTFVVDKK